jgi:DNA-binding transcriptional regulator GbsR (MarR family)
MATEPATRFIERLGLNAEEGGFPRIAGRMFAHLLLAQAPCSLDDIATNLDVSKGSASTNARLLERHGWLRRVVMPGDRRDYYEMVPDFFAEFVGFRMRQWQTLRDVVGEALTQQPQLSGVARDRLEYLQESQAFFLDGMQERLAEWQQRHRAVTRGSRIVTGR